MNRRSRGSYKGALDDATQAELDRLLAFARRSIGDAVEHLKKDEKTRQEMIVVVFNPHDAMSREFYRALAASPFRVPSLPPEPERGSVQVVGMLYAAFHAISTEVYGRPPNQEPEALAPDEVAVILFANGKYVRTCVKTTTFAVPRGTTIARGGIA
jgi:hypothetical protein